MKKIVIALAAVLTLTSCEGLLNAIQNEPIFTPAASEVLDGQAFVLHRAGTCDYFWVTSSDGKVNVNITPNPTINGDGKQTVAYVQIAKDGLGYSVPLTIQAFNNDDMEKVSEQEIAVKRWYVSLLDENGDMVSSTFNGETTARTATLAGGKKYTAVIVDAVDNTVIDRVKIRGIGKELDGAITFDTPTNITEISHTAVSLTFAAPSSGKVIIQAFPNNSLLGVTNHVTRSIEVTFK